MLPDSGSRVREKRRQQTAYRRARLDERYQHRIELVRSAHGTRALRLRQIAGPDTVDVAIGLVNHSPDRPGGAPEVKILQRDADQARRLAARHSEIFPLISRPTSSSQRDVGNVSVAIAMNHRDHPVDQIAEPIGQLIIRPGHKPLQSEIRVPHP